MVSVSLLVAQYFRWTYFYVWDHYPAGNDTHHLDKRPACKEARSRLARSPIPEEKWGTTRSLATSRIPFQIFLQKRFPHSSAVWVQERPLDLRPFLLGSLSQLCVFSDCSVDCQWSHHSRENEKKTIGRLSITFTSNSKRKFVPRDQVSPLLVAYCPLFLHTNEYSQLSLRRTPLGPALSVRLIESQIKGVKKGRDQL